MDWSWGYLTLAALAGLVGGSVNSLAGGGTLISFPALTALGIPALQANVTNTMATECLRDGQPSFEHR